MQPTEPGAEVIHGNAIDLPLPDDSVDLIITSPPYFALRSYRDGDEHYDGQIGSESTPQDFLEALWAATAEMKRVLKPSGSIWVNLGDKYAGSGGHNNSNIGADSARGPGRYSQSSTFEVGRRIDKNEQRYVKGEVPKKSLMGLPWRYAIGCVDQLGLILRAEVIWSKPNGLPESVTDRVRRSHEQWFHFTKSPRYFSAVDEVREAHSDRRDLNGAKDREDYEWNRDESGQARQWEPKGERAYNPLGKLPGSVWTIPSEPLIIPDAVKAHYNLPDHFAAFPQEWPRRIILGWSPSGICVACGEGRRPVVDRTYNGKQENTATWVETRTAERGWGDRQFQRGERVAVTGYACACPEPTAPTRPAVVLDPFGGTGTVAMVARALGRYGASVDLSADYCRLAEWRIFQSGHADNLVRKAIESGAMDAKQVPSDTLERARPRNAPQAYRLFDMPAEAERGQ